VLSLPMALRFPLATRPAVLSAVLGIVYRTISAHLPGEAHVTRRDAGVARGAAPDTAELQALVQRIAERLGRMLGRRGPPAESRRTRRHRLICGTVAGSAGRHRSGTG
jgi:hypothetical protein